MQVPDDGLIRFEEDLKHSLDYIQSKFPNDRIFAIGHSFGANILFKYLGRYHGETPVKAAVSVANPFDLYLASKYIKGTIYEGYVTHVRQMNLSRYFRDFVEFYWFFR